MKHSRTTASDIPVQRSRRFRSKDRVPVALLAWFRQGAYRIFSTLLLYPEAERLEAALELALGLDLEAKHHVGLAFFDRWQPLLTVLAGVSERNLDRMRQEYSELFVARPEGICHPSESVCLEQQGHTAGRIMAQLEKEYATAGLSLSPDLYVMPDHVAVELEFMSFLCSQEAEAWDRKNVKDGIQTLERQAAFLGGHLARWIPNWARQLTMAGGGGIYSVAAETAHAFICHDQDLISTLLHRLMPMPETLHSEAVDTARKP